MSDVKRGFSFNVNNSPITTVVADGKLWLAFYQLGEALGVGNLRKSLTNHVTDSDLTYFLMENEHSGLNRHRFISEKGVFSILQGRRDGKTDSLRLAIRDNIVPALKADRLNIDPIDVDKDADLNIYYFNLNKKRLTAVFIDNDIYFRKGDVAELIKIHQPAFDKYVREHATKKSVFLLNIPNKVNVTTRASFVSIGEVNRILIDRGGQLCDDLREFIAMTVVPKMTPAIPESLAKDSEIKTSIPKKDCTATSCPLCERPCQAGSTDSGFITNNGVCLRCCFGKSTEQVKALVGAKTEGSKPAPAVDDTFNDDTPAQTFGDISENDMNAVPFASFDLAAGEDKSVTCDFFSIPDDVPMRLIGIAGQAQSGKNTLASHLLSNLSDDWTQSAFADPIKNMLTAIGVDCSDEAKAVIDEAFDVTPRYMMQTLGTDWGRHMIGGEIWVKAFARLNAGMCVVVPDVRFENEADLVREHGVLIHLTGRGGIEGGHISENPIEFKAGDIVLDNSRELAWLHAQVDGNAVLGDFIAEVSE